MVTEQVEAPAVDEVVTPEVTPEVPATPAAEPTPEEDPELSEYLASAGLSISEKETEATPVSGLTPELQSKVEELANQKVTQERTKAQRKAQEDGIVNAFQNRTGAIRGFLANLGVAPADAERVVQTFVDHHAATGTVHARTFLDNLYKSAEEVVPGISERRDAHENYTSFLADLKESVAKDARKGYVSEAQKKAFAAAELLKYKKSLEEKGLLSASRAPTPAGSRGAAGVPSLAQWNSMTLEQREAARKADPEIDFKIR